MNTLALHIAGPLRIVSPDGSELRTNTLKARAVLALVACSPQKVRARAWVCEKLWGDRAPPQAMASLRSALAELRRILGTNRDVLIVDKFEIRLDPDLVWIDVDHSPSFPAGTELLEGLCIAHADAFEEWLRQERQYFEETKVGKPASASHHQNESPGTCEIPTKLDTASTIVIAPSQGDAMSAIGLLGMGLVDRIISALCDGGLVDVIDLRHPFLGATERSPDPSLELERQGVETATILSVVHATHSRGGLIRATLSEFPRNALIWSQMLEIEDQSAADLGAATSLVNQVVNIVSQRSASAAGDDVAAMSPRVMTNLGVWRMFCLGARNFEIADRLFARTHRQFPCAIALAWRAYLRTFQVCEREARDCETLIAEGIDFQRRALELEPHNSMVLALSAHTESMLRRNYGAAANLAQRAIDLDPHNPIGWASLGVAHCYLGDPIKGWQQTERARVAARHAPYSFQVEMLASAAAALAGNFEQATRLSEKSHGHSPDFAPPQRYLAALYARIGDDEKSDAMVKIRQQFEPDFSLDLLKDVAYPAAVIRRTGMLDRLPGREI